MNKYRMKSVSKVPRSEERGSGTKERAKVNKGFTLIELMITLVIAGIFVSLALPSFSQFLRNQRVTTQANEFVTALQTARSEAIKRRELVSVRADNSAGSSNEWGGGWSVYVNSATVILRVQPALEGNNLLNSVGDNTNYSYRSSGAVNATDTLYLCSSVAGDTARMISIKPTGRIKVSKAPCP